ncbi:MAG TPA: YibE/F family protein, partial [Catenuloplanes sp.]
MSQEPDGHPVAGHGHSHGHGHGAVPAASRRTRRLVAAVLVPAAVATLVALVLLWPGAVARLPDNTAGQGGQRVFGVVTSVVEQVCPPPADGAAQGPTGWARRCGAGTVMIMEGPRPGEEAEVDLPQGPGAPRLRVGDQVVLLYFAEAAPGGRAYAVIGHQRGTPMVWMLALAVAVVIAFGRWRGVSSLAGLAVSFAVLLLFVIPAILNGSPPLLVAVVGAAAIMFVALYLTHGVTAHTSVAVLGTLASLVLTGVLGAAFTSLTNLTGVGGEDSSHLATLQVNVDLRGLLLAGIVIGSLGVLDDVTVTQAVTVAEMSGSTSLSRLQLYRAATRVGRAHVASAVNTIVLAYAGASLPLLLVITAGNRGVTELLTSEFLAQEILRCAVGTIGLVASVPITTALAVLVAQPRPP